LIRNAQATDINEISRLCSQLGYKVNPEEIALRLERLIQNQENVIFVFESQGC
jgi:hypothetical protein